jgi:DNA-binding protein H-NS
MHHNEKHAVGRIQLPAQASPWLIQIAVVIAPVDRAEFLREIDSLISQVRAADRQAAIEQARAMVAEFGLLETDVFAPKPPVRETFTAKYRDPATGNAWSGRGPTPSWLRGKNLAEYAVS